ncbi:MAG TPA: DUF4129 domain-containing protein [Gaiellaceae bacterium]|nr:DUF4129 domain-containing protein [Gaiellaceae bacterium]
MDYGRGFRSLLMTGALVLLLGLVAFSSRSGFHSSSAPAVSNTYISYAMSVFLVVFVLMIPVAIYSYFVRTKEMAAVGGRTPGKQFRRMVYALVLIGIALYVRRYIHTHGGLFGHNGLFHVAKDPTNGAHVKGAGGNAQQQQPHFEWIVLWISLAVGAVAATAAYVAYKRRPPLPEREPLTLAEEFAAGFDDAIDDLEREADPRKAVIAAYARMERTFERLGLARRPSETAIEYLRRVLHELTSRSGAVERLTSLFESAKFSRHEVTVDMKNDAISSLREIRESIA